MNRIAVDKLAMKNRPSGPASSIELPPPGETSIGFPWRPVPEHLANLLGIGEPLIAGDPLLSQTGQLPCPLGRTSLRKAQWFDLCPMTDPFFKETVEVVKEIAPGWRTWDMHAIMQRLREAYQSKKPCASRLGKAHLSICSPCYTHGSITPRVFPPPSNKRMMDHSTYLMLTSGCG